MLSAGELIWASCRPLIRLVLCVAGGFVLTKTDNFPPVAARGAGQIMLNIALPCLMFSKIVPAFTSDNIGALGPLVLVALIYEGLGIAMAWLIKQFFWVPHRFRYGILVAGGWGNSGDIPTSVIVSVTGAAPFNGPVDQTLSVAYISAIILVFMLTLFPCGGNRWIAMDFVGPDVEPEEVKAAVERRRRAFLYALPNAISWITGGRVCATRHIGKEDIGEYPGTNAEKSIPADRETHAQIDTEHMNDAKHGTARHVSFNNDTATVIPTDGVRSPIYSPTPTEVGFVHSAIGSPTATIVGGDHPKSILQTHNDLLPTTTKDLHPTEAEPPSAPSSTTTRRFSVPSWLQPVINVARTVMTTLFSPASLSILLSFPIAVIPPLKGLFVELPASNSTSVFDNPHISPAPDGHPPLAIILDTATFIGAASVPLGLICLGAALARLKVPRDQWGSLPTGAIGMLAVMKMLVLPVIGVGLTRQLVTSGIIREEDKVLQFVCIFVSCLPTATTQVFLTQVFSGTGSAEHLPAFLIPQYIIMFISMTGLTAYTLQYLF